MAVSSTSKFIPALLVIDMQHDFVHGSLAVPGAASIIDTVNSILSLPFKIKIGTKDFHPTNHISFAETHQAPVFSKIAIYPPGGAGGSKAFEQVLWPVHCVASTPGSEFVEGLDQEALDVVILKGTDPGVEMYSAFGDPWHILRTSAHKRLEACGVTDIFVVGLAGDYCVKSSAIDAVDLGYKTWVIRDATRSVSESGLEWEEMDLKGIRQVNSKNVQDMLANYISA